MNGGVSACLPDERVALAWPALPCLALTLETKQISLSLSLAERSLSFSSWQLSVGPGGFPPTPLFVFCRGRRALSPVIYVSFCPSLNSSLHRCRVSLVINVGECVTLDQWGVPVLSVF